MGTTSTAASEWVPPGKNCGACGSRSCAEFTARLQAGNASTGMCPFFREDGDSLPMAKHAYSGVDVVGAEYDWVMSSMPGEPSARKIILPYRPDLVERWDIKKGDIVTGRPAGAGCPVQHVVRVITADPITGVITGHVVGPAYARDREVKDVREYHMLGFEGRAIPIRKEPRFGIRYSFLPGFCMMDRAHTGLVNMVINKPWGLQVRVEGIVIL